MTISSKISFLSLLYRFVKLTALIWLIKRFFILGQKLNNLAPIWPIFCPGRWITKDELGMTHPSVAFDFCSCVACLFIIAIFMGLSASLFVSCLHNDLIWIFVLYTYMADWWFSPLVRKNSVRGFIYLFIVFDFSNWKIEEQKKV